MGSRIAIRCKHIRYQGDHILMDFRGLTDCVKDVLDLLDLLGYDSVYHYFDNDLTAHIIGIEGCYKSGPLLMNHFRILEDQYSDMSFDFYYENKDEFEDWELGIEPDDPEEGLEKD